MAADDSHNDRTQSFVALIAGTTVSHYKIIEKIGAGGMGEVYLAEDTELDRQVALKFLPPHLCQDEDCRKRFKREAQAAAKLSHPNIVTIHEVNEYQGRPYFVMEHVEGQSLREFSADKELSLEQILELGIQICEGLNDAHEKGVTHRDIKPSNILIDSHGRARIVDFGLASIAGTDQLTRTGSTLGTIGYMSPEQVQGKDIDHRSDLFLLGVVLYELITNQNPFKRDSEAATLRAVTDHIPEPLARYNRNTPELLEKISFKLLEKNPAHRYQSAAGVISDLKRLARDQLSDSQKEVSQPSIAVLPFANLSADPEQEYFCDGMAEEITNALTHIENLRVIARTSAFAFKGKHEDVRQIGRKLDVETLLEGSVRKAGNRLRITAQLVKVSDGSHLWSERYDRDIEDVFAIQDEISQAVVDRLRITLLRDKSAALVKCGTDNVEAYTLYLKGRYYWNKRTSDGLTKAIQQFEDVIEMDPGFALAYVGLADCYNLLTQAWVLPPREAFPKAKVAALKALEIDESLAEAHTSLAFVRTAYEWDWLEAEKGFKRAIELNPSYATAHHWYAMFLVERRRPDEALTEIRKAQELDPLSLILGLAAALILISARQYTRAEEECRKVLDMDPNFVGAHGVLGMAYELEGKYDEAIEEYLRGLAFYSPFSSQDVQALRDAYSASGWRGYWQRHVEILKRQSKRSYVPASGIALAYARLGEKNQVFEWLEKAYGDRDLRFTFIAVDPSFDSVRSDPRFAALMRRMGLEE